MSEQVVTPTVAGEDVRQSVLALWREIFGPSGEDGPSWVLDRGTSMFDTLAGISAEEASIPVSNQSATLAAQVDHTAYYIQELREGIDTNWANTPDWDASWQIGAVDAAQWQALIDNLRADYEWFTQLAETNEVWTADYIGGAIAMIAHAAYHLGEIRQGIGVIRSRTSTTT